MFRAAAVLALASLLLTALALISCLSIEDKRAIRGLPRWLWVLAILLVPVVGAIGWFLAGRPLPAGRSAANWPAAAGRRESPSARAPDDDPEFLRSLDQGTLSAHEEDLLRRWQEDLDRHEDEQRRRDPGTDG